MWCTARWLTLVSPARFSAVQLAFSQRGNGLLPRPLIPRCRSTIISRMSTALASSSGSCAPGSCPSTSSTSSPIATCSATARSRQCFVCRRSSTPSCTRISGPPSLPGVRHPSPTWLVAAGSERPRIVPPSGSVSTSCFVCSIRPCRPGTRPCSAVLALLPIRPPRVPPRQQPAAAAALLSPVVPSQPARCPRAQCRLSPICAAPRMAPAGMPSTAITARCSPGSRSISRIRASPVCSTLNPPVWRWSTTHSCGSVPIVLSRSGNLKSQDHQ
mmetsp:Transcript_2652/g.6393  ORF Transcript_2652/g.6393 Transcript_2652/m.6393 type:complete len:272 (-) Transcript_2652:870-1685(-)